MLSYSAVEEKWSGESVWVLSGPLGARAVIAPGIGANLVELVLPLGEGQSTVSVIDAPPDLAALKEAPSRYGAPVLFPFPSRVAKGHFTFAGNEYQLDVYPDGNARHGFVMARQFTIVGHGAGPDGAWVSLACDGNVPDVQRQFPFPFEFELTFSLSTTGLGITATGKNTGGSTMPMGFGWHPYFKMPLADKAQREQCFLQVPAAKYWELAPDLVPTGRCLPVDGKLDLRSGPALGENTYDDIFTDVERDHKGWSHASISDPVAGAKVTLSAGPSFREWVIYAPPGRSAACLEPYTCAGNAFNLQAAGFDAGVIELAPGETWTDTMRVTLTQYS